MSPSSLQEKNDHPHTIPDGNVDGSFDTNNSPNGSQVEKTIAVPAESQAKEPARDIQGLKVLLITLLFPSVLLTC